MSNNQCYHEILRGTDKFLVPWQMLKICCFYFNPSEYNSKHFQQYIKKKIKIRKAKSYTLQNGSLGWELQSRSGKTVFQTKAYDFNSAFGGMVVKIEFFDLMNKLKSIKFEGLDKLKELKQVDDEFDLDPEKELDKQEKKDNQDNKGNQGGTLCSIS